jgi:hypothetical protein
MTTSRLHLYQIGLYAALLSALAAHPVMAQEARLDRDCTPQLTYTQQRLYQKASEGTDTLRNFIFIRRAILQVDSYETAIWAASLSRARAACMETVSDARSSPKLSR